VLAAVVHQPGPPEVLQVEERPAPEAREGWIVVRVRAFGLNRSELVTRAGGSGDAVRFPRVLGIEAVGEVVEDPSGTLAPGQAFVAAMGEMGRAYDGGYEQYALLPEKVVIPVDTTLDWPTLGALPETFGTAWGSLDTLDLQPGATLLVRGATSSVGMAAITIAKDRGLTVVGTTRREAKRGALEANGADHVVVDDGAVGQRVRELLPDGVDGLLELVGPTAMLNSLRALRDGGRACISGFLEGDWEVGDAQAAARERGIAFGRFGSAVIDRDSYGAIMRDIVSAVEARRLRPNVDRLFALDDVAEAHRHMEANRASGKVVGLPPED
jgi:NADPH:quinone reductase-like Zn-dependent oxidoreductase